MDLYVEKMKRNKTIVNLAEHVNNLMKAHVFDGIPARELAFLVSFQLTCLFEHSGGLAAFGVLPRFVNVLDARGTGGKAGIASGLQKARRNVRSHGMTCRQCHV